MGQHTASSDSRKMIVKIVASCLLAFVAASSESSSSESGSREGFRGPGLLFSPIEVDLACTAGSPLGAKLASAFETCLGGEEALKPEEVGASETERRRRRPTRGRNAQLLSRSRPRWEREWKVTGACSPNLAGSMRMETRTTRLQLLT